MKNTICLTIFSILLLVSMVSAYSSQIEIKTLPAGKLVVSILIPNTIYDLIESFRIQADSMGQAQLNYTSTREEVDIKVEVNTASNQFIFAQRFEDIKTNKPYFIQALKDNVDSYYLEITPPVANVTDTNSTSNNTGVTGNVVSDSFKLNINWKYVLTGVLIVFFAFSIFMFIIKKNKGVRVPKEIKTTPASDLPGISSKLEQTEKQLKEAQKELARLRNQEKIKEIESRISQEQSELDKLRNGY